MHVEGIYAASAVTSFDKSLLNLSLICPDNGLGLVVVHAWISVHWTPAAICWTVVKGKPLLNPVRHRCRHNIPATPKTRRIKTIVNYHMIQRIHLIVPISSIRTIIICRPYAIVYLEVMMILNRVAESLHLRPPVFLQQVKHRRIARHASRSGAVNKNALRVQIVHLCKPSHFKIITKAIENRIAKSGIKNSM